MSGDTTEAEIKFSTDIVELSYRFGILTDRSKEFNALSNFQISILSEVQASEYSGFTCRVTFYTGEVLGSVNFMSLHNAILMPVFSSTVMRITQKSKLQAGGRNGCRHLCLLSTTIP